MFDARRGWALYLLLLLLPTFLLSYKMNIGV